MDLLRMCTHVYLLQETYEELRKSVEEAVWKSDPLPTPPDDELFHPELSITFDPQ